MFYTKICSLVPRPSLANHRSPPAREGHLLYFQDERREEGHPKAFILYTLNYETHVFEILYESASNGQGTLLRLAAEAHAIDEQMQTLSVLVVCNTEVPGSIKLNKKMSCVPKNGTWDEVLDEKDFVEVECCRPSLLSKANIMCMLQEHNARGVVAVSYTHLTLPTILLV